ncbi:hypothetical protein V1477_009109 [Vespula maculifrons]|uniref:Uncharacterized protein n=1 Tax=Vespula maculifrons TaxID=7453 RepID=A0ABD2CFM5_VESMC
MKEATVRVVSVLRLLSKLQAQTLISSELSRLKVSLANEELQPGIGVRFLNLKTSVYLDVADHRH